jgi:hypothetical protein
LWCCEAGSRFISRRLKIRQTQPTNQEVLINVIIGIDPQKAAHTAVAIGCDEAELGTVTVRATKQQAGRFSLNGPKPLNKPIWAIESAGVRDSAQYLTQQFCPSASQGDALLLGYLRSHHR